ncbi:MAG: hypothetical protein AAFX99_01590 [Myxococcota bacterium]
MVCRSVLGLVLLLAWGCIEPEAPVTSETPRAVEPSWLEEVQPALSCDASCLSSAEPSFEWPQRVLLPYASVGAAQPPHASLKAICEGASMEVVEVAGPLQVERVWAAEPSWTVRYTGRTDAPQEIGGVVRLECRGQLADVPVMGVVGHAALPTRIPWTQREGYRQAMTWLPSSPLQGHRVAIVVPDGVGEGVFAQGVSLIVHTHGLNATVPSVLDRQRLAEQLVASGRDAVLVVPQGGVQNNFGTLYEPGGFERLMDDVVALLYRDGQVRVPQIDRWVLSAHSAGYRAVAKALQHGLKPDAVLLFDALYGMEEAFVPYIAEGGRFRSIHTPGGLRTWFHNRRLLKLLAEAGVTVQEQLNDATLVQALPIVSASTLSHEGCVRGERHAQRLWATSGLPPRRDAPLDLVWTRSQGDGLEATVRWRLDVGVVAQEATVQLQGSMDGRRWEVLAEVPMAAEEHQVAQHPWLRLARVAPDGGVAVASDRYGATGDRWLVVDGFDRTIDGGWRMPTHDFATQLGQALRAPFSVASHEAVADGSIRLGDFARVLWVLGDEGQDDVTFDAREQAALETYLKGDGQLVVSGSDVGFATDDLWMDRTLHVSSPGGHPLKVGVETWGLNSAYPEVMPDLLEGDTVFWRYSRGGAAAVGWNHRIAVVGFALENLAEPHRVQALGTLQQWLDRRQAAHDLPPSTDVVAGLTH